MVATNRVYAVFHHLQRRLHYFHASVEPSITSTVASATRTEYSTTPIEAFTTSVRASTTSTEASYKAPTTSMEACIYLHGSSWSFHGGFHLFLRKTQ